MHYIFLPVLVMILVICFSLSLQPSLKFWKSVARAVPKPSDEFRIFNPLIIRETAELVGMKVGNGKVGKVRPKTSSLWVLLLKVDITFTTDRPYFLMSVP